MHTLLLVFLALTVDSETSPQTLMVDRHPSTVEPWAGEPYPSDVLRPFAEHAGPTPGLPGSWQPPPAPKCWPWLRAHRPQRPLLPRYPAHQQYYRNRPYDPRLMLDYPWHARRVSQPWYPVFPPDGWEPDSL